MAKTQSIFGQEVRDNIPRDYILIPRELYTNMVEITARYDMMDGQIPVEWDMSFLDVFNKGMETINDEKLREAEIAEIKRKEEEEAKRKRAEEKEARAHRCPDPGKVKSLMGAGWSAEDLSCEFNAPVAEVYEWLSQICRGEYDSVLNGMEVGRRSHRNRNRPQDCTEPSTMSTENRSS